MNFLFIKFEDLISNQNNMAIDSIFNFIGIQNKDMNTLVCSVTKDINHKFKAGDLVKNIAIKLGLNGGGLPHMAITNFKNKELLEKAINIGFELIKDQA